MLEQVIFNKAGWTRVAFGDVVDCVKGAELPPPEFTERYIGLEHLEQDSLTVWRWGSEMDLAVPKTKVKKGDVLFARRNTHLRRCAVAPFDTYFSPDGYAFRAKTKALSQNYLLYLVASDEFMHFAIKNSAGTHSKRVKWTDLQGFQFFLPPLAEQVRVSAMLDAAWRSLDAQKRLLVAADQLHASLASDLFASALKTFGEVALGEICEKISVGIVIRPADYYTTAPDGVPALIMKNVQRGWLDLSELNRITPTGHELHSKSKLRKGDVVAVRSSGSIERTGDAAVVPASLDGSNCIDLLMVRPGTKIVAEYLCHFMNAPSSRGALLHNSAGTMQKHLNVGQLKKVEIPAAPLKEQDRIVSVLKESEDKREAVASRISAMRNMFEVLQANWFERVE